MEQIEPIHITHEDFLKLLEREVGYGTDGTVCKYNRTSLIKVYHSKIYQLLKSLEDYQADIKIYHMGTPHRIQEPITAYFYNRENEEHIKMQTKDAISMAIEKQKNVKRTKLPQNIVYIDHLFSGCLLERIYGVGIHQLIGFPLTVKRKIMLDVLESVKELLVNHIYPCDLGNSPRAKDAVVTKDDGRLVHVGHSHILVNPITLKTNIIDLDGNSTIYTDFSNDKLLSNVYHGVSRLLVEFFLAIDTEDMVDEEYEKDTLAYYLDHLGIKNTYIDDLKTYQLGINQVEEVVKTYKL